jgi:SanA protein
VKISRKFKFLLYTISGLVTFFLILILICNFWVIKSTESKIYTSVQVIPFNDVALILGTSKYFKNGNPNQFFNYRIEAAVKLYYYKKIRHIIVSGDNSLSYYNEPADMKKALIARGVPDSVITLDYAGFRTFDSVVRSKKIFNQRNITIITQRFHLYRAIFIGSFYEIDAVGFVADNTDEKKIFTIRVREYLARFLAVLDLYIFRKTPKFLGKKEDIAI